MAGEPKPCVMRLKWVRLCWIDGSRIWCGRVLHSGDRSWLSRSMNSFTMTLQEREREQMMRSICLLNCPLILTPLPFTHSETEKVTGAPVIVEG